MYYFVTVSVGLAISTMTFSVLGSLFGLTSGSDLYLSVAIAAAICLVIADSVGSQARKFPASPGVRTYIASAFGDRVSLLSTFCYLSFIVLVSGAEIYVFTLTLSRAAPDVPQWIVAAVMPLVILAVNLKGCFSTKSNADGFDDWSGSCPFRPGRSGAS